MVKKAWFPCVAFQGATLSGVPQRDVQLKIGPGQSRLIEKTNLQVGMFVYSIPVLQSLGLLRSIII